jgi:hypothetical protein
MELIDFDKLRGRRLASVLALVLDGTRLEGAVLRRTNGSLQVQQSFQVALTLDPLTADPLLVGREIRNHLDAAGVRERACVAGLPLRWALTSHLELPKLAAEDVESFLQLEAERTLPADPATLRICSSRCHSASGKEYALLAGIARSHVATIERVLRAARLKPVSLTLGILGLQGPAIRPGQSGITLAIGETGVSLEVTCGNGIAALRTFEGTVLTEASRRTLEADLIAREARVTLGQLPAELRDSVRSIRIYGPRDLSQQLADKLELRMEASGLQIEAVTQFVGNEFPLQLPAGTAAAQAIGLAALTLAGRKPAFEFLPPRINAWKRAVSRYSSGKWRTVGVAAGCLALLLTGLFLFQQFQLIRFGSQWNRMAVKVTELQKLEEQVRQYRSWYDDSLVGLTIMKQLSEAFPETGIVTAKTLEIREPGLVTCTGTTRDQQSLTKTLERLRGLGRVSDLRVIQIRGKSPMQFTFDFRWNEGGPR